MSSPSRRDFLVTGSASVLALGVASVIPRAVKPPQAGSSFRIELIPGQYYSESFVRFTRKASFSSPAEAASSVLDRRLAYRIVAS